MLKTKEALPIPKGDAEFERKRHEILSTFAAKIPKDLILPPEVLDNTGPDVTSVPRSCGLLTEEELDITENYGLVSLAEVIAAGKLSAVAVTSAFCKRAIIAHQVTFCLSDIYMDEAIERAKFLDKHLADTGRTVGPLHGVPISIEEMMPVANQLCSLGILSTRYTASQDCLLVEILRDLGAVFYVKTHQPAAVLSLECTSALGRTLNPYNTALSAGGSSGGEAALIAMRGSVLGVGTDIGGSVRTPAMCCGIYALKSSSGFLPAAGMLPGPAVPRINLEIIIGFMSSSWRDLKRAVFLVQDTKPFLRDPDVLPITLSRHLGGEKVREPPPRVGIMMSDGATATQPPVAKALEWTRKRLLDAGFTVKPFRLYRPEEAHRLFYGIILPDRGATLREALGGSNEPKYPSLEEILHTCRTIDPRVKPSSSSSSSGEGEEQEETASIIAQRRFERDAYRAAFLADWIAQGNPDIVISPASFGVATAHETGFYPNHTSVWNLVDYPAAIIPTPLRAEARERYETKEYEDLEVLGDHDRRARDLWKENDYSAAPVCVQICAKRHMEEKLFAAMENLREVLELPW